jgi:hypothetical protein
MSGAVQTFVAGLVAIGVLTALLLPGRQTPAVIKATAGLLQGSLRTAITGK